MKDPEAVPCQGMMLPRRWQADLDQPGGPSKPIHPNPYFLYKLPLHYTVPPPPPPPAPRTVVLAEVRGPFRYAFSL